MRKITLADVRRNPEAANAAYLDGATLRVTFTEAFEVWRSLDSVDLGDNLKAEIGLAGQELGVRGGSTTVEADRVKQLAASLLAQPAPVAGAAGPGGQRGFAWGAAGAVAGALAVAAVIVAVGFGVGFVAGFVLGGDDKGSVEVNNGGDGSVTVNRPAGD
jgi:hypothetical protein